MICRNALWEEVSLYIETHVSKFHWNYHLSVSSYMCSHHPLKNAHNWWGQRKITELSKCNLRSGTFFQCVLDISARFCVHMSLVEVSVRIGCKVILIPNFLLMNDISTVQHFTSCQNFQPGPSANWLNWGWWVGPSEDTLELIPLWSPIHPENLYALRFSWYVISPRIVHFNALLRPKQTPVFLSQHTHIDEITTTIITFPW